VCDSPLRRATHQSTSLRVLTPTFRLAGVPSEVYCQGRPKVRGSPNSIVDEPETAEEFNLILIESVGDIPYHKSTPAFPLAVSIRGVHLADHNRPGSRWPNSQDRILHGLVVPVTRAETLPNSHGLRPNRCMVPRICALTMNAYYALSAQTYLLDLVSEQCPGDPEGWDRARRDSSSAPKSWIRELTRGLCTGQWVTSINC